MPLPLPALLATLALLATAAAAPAVPLAVPLPLLLAPVLFPVRRAREKTNMFQWFVDNAPDEEWRSYFRVSRKTFRYIVGSIAHLECFFVNPNNLHNAVTVERQVAAFLFRAGGMPVLKVRSLLDIGKHTICKCTKRVTNAILEVHGREIYLPPNGSPEAGRVAEQFRVRGFDGARGIIDCTRVPIVVATDIYRAGNRYDFVDKDHRVAKTFQVICDTNMRIMDVAGGQSGKAHDMTVLRASGVYRDIATYLDFGRKEFFMGDSGYTLRPWLQHGYTRPEVSEGQSSEKEYYNRRYSGVRITIERVFGGAAHAHARVRASPLPPPPLTIFRAPAVLKARFAALSTRLFFRFPTSDMREYSKFFKACCILHNICLRFKDEPSEKEITDATERERNERVEWKQAQGVAPLAPAAALVGSADDGKATRRALAEKLNGKKIFTS
jgi:hypothetical protein